jgi:hypothetical protein
MSFESKITPEKVQATHIKEGFVMGWMPGVIVDVNDPEKIAHRPKNQTLAPPGFPSGGFTLKCKIKYARIVSKLTERTMIEHLMIQSRLSAMLFSGSIKYSDTPLPSSFFSTILIGGCDDIGTYTETTYVKKVLYSTSSLTCFAFEVVADLTRLYRLEQKDKYGHSMAQISESDKKGVVLLATPIQSFSEFEELWYCDYTELLIKSLGDLPIIRTLSEPMVAVREESSLLYS